MIENLSPLSLTGTRYMLKQLLHYSYKRASILEKKIFTPELIRLFSESLYFQKHLSNSGYRLIWVDEFHSNWATCRGYNWSLRGTKAILPNISKRSSLNFTMAINEQEVLLI